MNNLEIILPLRNPPAVLEQTARSLAAQIDRRFSVLLSDNHSTQGAEHIEAAAAHLESAGIAVRRVKPPFELGRVEHWNWAHHNATGDWVKPLFAGDWLEPSYTAEIGAARFAHPECKYIFALYVYHHGDAPPVTSQNPWTGRFLTAERMQQVVLRSGMQFGPPSAAAYERDAFVGLGGYPVALPICSDSLFFCALAARHGVLGLAEPLCHFNIHAARFSTTLPQKRRATFFESITYFLMLANQARAGHVPFPRFGFLRLLLRETRAYLKGK